MSRSMHHLPVLLHESIEGLAIRHGGTYVDCTTNRGGHSYEIAKRLGKQGILVCIDLDKNALKEAEEHLATLGDAPTIYYVHSNFRNLKTILDELHIKHVDGILADLGLSSQELDISKRGFSFRFDEPLQMTFNSHPEEETLTAYDIVNSWSESTLADILYGFADETYAKRIAREIVNAREIGSIETTHQLVDIISRAVPALYRHKRAHFATKTFQALRMAVNDELGSIQDLLAAVPFVLKPQGRIAIITFHSTEDRIVKQGLRTMSALFSRITKKAIVPTEQELLDNPRARSAQLRIAEKN